MLFKSEKKILKNLIQEVVNEKAPAYVGEVREIRNNRNYDEEALEMELAIAKKRHLEDVFDTVIRKLSDEHPEKADSLRYMVMDPGYCGYDLDLENGFLAGGVYAIAYYALFGKVAAATDCAELNSKHAFVMAQAAS